MNILQYTQIITIGVIWLIYIYGLLKVIRGRSANKWNIVLGLTLATLLIVYLTLNAYTIVPPDWVQIILMFGLVLATIQYAISASKQANASIKMAEEIKEQRYDAVRPVIDIYRDQAEEDKMPEALEGKAGEASRGLSCVLENIGLGPAIDVYSFVQNPQSGELQRHEFGTLAIGKKTYRMKLSLIHEGNLLALVAYYRDVYGRDFVSRREVSADEKKGWEIGPLQTRLVT